MNTINFEQKNGKLLITKELNATKDLVWKLWTDPVHLAKWWGPTGFNIIVKKFDLQPEGIFHYCMEAGEDTMWGRFTYKEISAPDKLVFTNSFSDEQGNITRAGFSNIWPLEVLNTLTLKEVDGKTILTLEGGPVNATPEEQKAYDEMFESMKQGFTGTFDQLDDYLATL